MFSVPRSVGKLCQFLQINRRNLTVLGIETSCDDTGIAIVRTNDSQPEQVQVLSNVLDSQQEIHTKYGGIIPPRAQELHRSRIGAAFERCMLEAQIEPTDLNAIAITTKPGLPMSLTIGLRFAKHLARKYQKPLVPIHHMEAHALQARMEHSIPYPFLCLLISGGHSQLAMVKSPYNFGLLGESIDDAPGEAFDKIARRLRLHTLPKYHNWNGGQMVEDAAKLSQNPDVYEFPLPLSRQRNCNFSFAGIKNNCFRAIRQTEQREKTPPDSIISNYNDFCAGLLEAVTRHLRNRTQRAIEYCISRDFFGTQQRSLVVSGGVANNDYIFNDISHLAEHFQCKTYRPSKKYCSDNGVMIAWNAIERIKEDETCLKWESDFNEIEVQGKATLGKVMIDDIENANLKCKWVGAAKMKQMVS